MPEHHLLPIPLPHGRDGSTGYLSVYMAPRLKMQQPLNQYQTIGRWAETVQMLTFWVEVDGSLVTANVVSPPANDVLWRAIFRPGTPVRAHRFEDWSQFDQLPMPNSDFDEAILALYAAIATDHGQTPPSGQQVVDTGRADVLFEAGGSLDQALEFISPMEGEGLLEEVRNPEWDFHQYLSLLGHHPEILRQLGLIVDFEITDLPPNPSSVIVRSNYDIIAPAAAMATEVPVRMNTTTGFLAHPHDKLETGEDSPYWEIEDGFLRLGAQGAYASILDTYSTATRVYGLAQAAGAGDGALPALSTRALTLVRPDLRTAFLNRTLRQAELEAEVNDFLAGGDPPTAFAEDVYRGHRIDVLDETSAGPEGATWRSLFERTSADGYHFPNDPKLDSPAPDDEGWTTTRLVTEFDERFRATNLDLREPVVPMATHRLDDQLYRWEGWSGAAPKPTKSIDAVTGALADISPQLPGPADPIQFAVTYQALPGSLPRLRFSHHYVMRARAVDLSGWSPAVSTPSPTGTEARPETFGRLEPIASPMVVRRNPRPEPGVGDAASTIVLLSDYDIADKTVDAQERLIFPGQVGQDLCELHGQPNGGADPASYEDLKQRSATNPEDRWSIDERSDEPIAGGDPRHAIDYLSDPAIGGLRASLLGENLGLDGINVALKGTWPEATSSRIVVEAGDGDTEVNPSEDVDLRLHIPKAEITSVTLAYAPTDAMVEDFGLWYQIEEADRSPALRDQIARGDHWMFSGRRRIDLVHAVRRPLTEPEIADLEICRSAGSTAATIDGDVETDRRSTGTLALQASWTDLVDDPNRPAPELRSSGAFLGRFRTPRAEDTNYSFEGHRSELGDTRRHLAFVDVEAFSAFSSYFNEERDVTATLNRRIIVDARGIAAGTAVVTTQAGHSADEGTDYKVDEDQGSIVFVPGGSIKTGEQTTIRYVPLPVSRTSLETGKGFEVLIPNTAVPARPIITNVAPAFAREGGGTDAVEHNGCVLRLHIGRPWNLTGDGEALAVLVDTGDPTPGSPMGSRLARDPAVATDHDVVFGVDNFPRSIETTTSEDGGHDLAIHEVLFDEELGHWYCDIEIDTDLYRPFIQLTVARYQADSIEGRTLGPSVSLEPVRLGVHRAVTARAVDGGYEISVSGTEHDGIPTDDGAKPIGTNDVIVRLQEADASIADPDLRWMHDLAEVSLARTTSNGITTWSGRVDVVPNGVAKRFVVEEHEPAMFGGSTPVATSLIVYSEVIPITK